jgi:outer membrane protein TolC
MVQYGIDNAPEILRIDAAIAAQKRFLTSVRNAFWSPTVVLQGEISHRFHQSGAGSDEGVPANIPAGLGFQFPSIDDTDWNLGVNLSFPLFRGTAKFAEKLRALEELNQLRIERKAISDRIEQRIRSTLHIAGASLAIIGQSRLAEESALQNLELVVDSYSRGALSIIELLDAQNAALVASEAASNAVYDFHIDYFEVERAIGRFHLLESETEKSEFRNKLEIYFRQAEDQ